jgi:hypothetical protein
MTVPLWVTLVTAAIFGSSAFLALNSAAAIYGTVESARGGAKPGTREAIVSIVVATIFGATLAARGTPLADLAVSDVVIAGLSGAIWTDRTRGAVADWFTLPPLGLVLGLAAFRGSIVATAIAVTLVTLPFAVAALASKGKGLSFGDVTIVAIGAAVMDAQTAIIVYAAVCFIACAVAIARRRRTQSFALSPYLAAAIAVGLLLPAERAFF